jgi:HD-GYP domain-containing protein (c-di-GMP phosphodiesterase class II)
MKNHPEAGYQLLKDINFDRPLALIVYQHHERINGAGYPQGIRGEEILPEARILAVADVVEAICTHRPYRPSLGIERALKEISEHSGVLYDPEAVDVCLQLFREKGFSFKPR